MKAVVGQRVAPSTIRGSCAAAATRRGYHLFEAHRRALGRRRMQRGSRLSRDQVLREWVTDKLRARWSPDQIAHELRRRNFYRPGQSTPYGQPVRHAASGQ